MEMTGFPKTWIQVDGPLLAQHQASQKREISVLGSDQITCNSKVLGLS